MPFGGRKPLCIFAPCLAFRLTVSKDDPFCYEPAMRIITVMAGIRRLAAPEFRAAPQYAPEDGGRGVLCNCCGVYRADLALPAFVLTPAQTSLVVVAFGSFDMGRGRKLRPEYVICTNNLYRVLHLLKWCRPRCSQSC